MTVPPFPDLLAATRAAAVHLEMRDLYTPNQPRFVAWMGGHREDPADRSSWWTPFHAAVADAVVRGVQVRRVRIISEPITDYIRFEHDVTWSNLAAGEQVRWLPRRRASDLALPGNDFWVFDNHLVRFGLFSGDGEFLEDEMCEAPTVVDLCVSAFNAAWDRAIPHENYKPV